MRVIYVLTIALALVVFVGHAKMRVTNQLPYPIKFEYHWIGPLPLGSIVRWGTQNTIGPLAPGETITANLGEVNLKSRYKIYVDLNDGKGFQLMLDQTFTPAKGGKRHVTVLPSFDNKVTFTDALW
jgi:hypothetical protein